MPYPPLTLYVDFKPQFVNPASPCRVVLYTVQKLTQQVPRHLLADILIDSNLQPIMALQEKPIRDGLGRVASQLGRDFLEREFHRLSHRALKDWPAEKSKD